MSEYIYGTDGHEGHWLTGEEIVRCRDCKHWATWDMSAMYQNHEHDHHACFKFIDGWRMETDANGFCAWGERRDG